MYFSEQTSLTELASKLPQLTKYYFSQPFRVNVVRRVKLATLDCLEPRVCVAQWVLMGSLAPVDYL